MPDARQSSILITRPEPGASETAARVAALGFLPVISPALRIEATRSRLPAPATVGAVVITSGNALAACWPEFAGNTLFAVGDGTANRARAMGFQRVTSADGDAVALASLITRTCRPGDGALLLASGRKQGGRLAASLRQAGFRVIRRVAYQAVAEQALRPEAVNALRLGQVRASLFFSAETARSFVRLIMRHGLRESLRSCDAISIGTGTSVALQALPWRHISDAAKPNQDAMLALLR